MPNNRYQENLTLLGDPRVQGMLKVIKTAEGTNNPRGYNTRVGYTYFDDLSQKPRQKVFVKSINDYSSAEGAYQFLDSTWDSLKNKLELKDFSKISQDVAAVELLREKGALDSLLKGDFKSAVHKAAPVWASLPKPEGGSIYSGQKAKRFDELERVYFGGASGEDYDSGMGDYKSNITIDYQNLTPQQIADLNRIIAGAPQDTAKEEAEADTAKQELSDRQKEKMFLEELNAAYGKAQVRPQQAPQQGVADDGSAYRVAQIQLPEYTPTPTPQIQFQRGGEVTKNRKDTASRGIAGIVDLIDDSMRPATNAMSAVAKTFFPNELKSVREKVFETYRPVSYPGFVSGITEATKKFAPGKDAQGDYTVAEEAWRKALDLPGKSKYIVPSKYKPSNAKNPKTEYYTLQGIIDPDKIKEYVKTATPDKKGVYPVESLAPFIKEGFMDREEFSNIDPLQNFQLHTGVDEKTGKKFVSLYDKYDFSFPMADAVIKPYEFYDRFYYEDKPNKGSRPKKELGGYFQEGGEKEPLLEFDMRDPLDYGVMTTGDLNFSAGVNVNPEQPHIRVGANYGRGNFNLDTEYRKGLIGDNEYSASLGYSAPSFSASAGYNKTSYGSNPEANINFRTGNLNTAVNYEHNKYNPSLGLNLGYGKGNFRAHANANYTKGVEKGINVGASYKFQQGGTQLTREDLRLQRLAEQEAARQAFAQKRAEELLAKQAAREAQALANTERLAPIEEARAQRIQGWINENQQFYKRPLTAEDYEANEKRRSSGPDQIYSDPMGIDERWKRKKGCNIATDSETSSKDYKQDGGYINSGIDYTTILNNLKRFQEGGTQNVPVRKVNLRQPDGSVKETYTNDPEYIEAYGKGNISRETPEGNLFFLDEVVITPNRNKDSEGIDFSKIKLKTEGPIEVVKDTTLDVKEVLGHKLDDAKTNKIMLKEDKVIQDEAKKLDSLLIKKVNSRPILEDKVEQIPEAIDFDKLNPKSKEDVMQVQKLLVEKGYNINPKGNFKNSGVDGILGNVTLNAIADYNQNIAKKPAYNSIKDAVGTLGRCTETQCSEFVQNEIYRNIKPNISREEWNKATGLYGDAWEIGKNIINSGGSKVERNKIRPGDVVTIYTGGGSAYQSQADKAAGGKLNSGTTHTAVVDKVNPDGSYYILHNVHVGDKVSGFQGIEYRDLVAPNGFVRSDNTNDGFYIKNAYRPNLSKVQIEPKKVVNENLKIALDPKKANILSEGVYNPTLSSNSAKNKLENTFLVSLNDSKNKKVLSKTFDLGDDEYNSLAKAALGILGQETNFGTNTLYTTGVKELGATALKNLKYKDDEVSKGAGRLKYNTNFGKGDLTELGINESNFTSEANAPLTTLYKLATDYKKFITKGENKKDALYKAITIYNVSLGHKGKEGKTIEQYAKDYDVDYTNKVLSYANMFDVTDGSNNFTTSLDKLLLNPKAIKWNRRLIKDKKF